jgi:hypothetical protein
LHGPKAREEVFYDSRNNVADMGLVVCGRWPFEKHEALTIPRLFESLLEDPAGPPLLEDLELELREWVPGR